MQPIGASLAAPALRRLRLLLPLLAILTVGAAPSARAEATPQSRFASPAAAVDALVAAARSASTASLVRVLGPGSDKVVSSGDVVADAAARKAFLDAFDRTHRIETLPDGRATLVVGDDDWPFPFPLVARGSTWRFDGVAGAAEILDRRIGANELATIEVCHAYVDAQRRYAERDRNGDGYVEYAQKLVSTPGRRDGLYWQAAAGEDESPIGPLMARARGEGYAAGARKGSAPYHGYLFRILTGQGTSARGGALDYVVKGHMIGGFALIATPARYGASGVMTFIVSHDGVVLQKDLGPTTAEIAGGIRVFDPGPGWTVVPER